MCVYLKRYPLEWASKISQRERIRVKEVEFVVFNQL